MKTQAITQNLRGSIQNFEKVIDKKRVQFGRASSQSYRCVYSWHSTLGVSSSAVYLYCLERTKDGKLPSIGISFDFYEKSGHYSNRNSKLPLDKQTVRFSYCLDTELPYYKYNIGNRKTKVVTISEPYFLDEAREIIKTMYRVLKSEKVTSERILKVMEQVAFHYSVEDESEAKNKTQQELKKYSDKLRSLQDTSDQANKEYDNALTQSQIEIESSAEYKAVQELEQNLKLARSKLNLKKSEVKAKVDLSNKSKAKLESKSNLIRANNEWDNKVRELMKKNGVSIRHFDELAKR